MDITKTPFLRERMLNKGELLAQFLNVAKGLRKQKSILRLLECCRALQQCLSGIVERRPLGRVSGASTLIYDLGDNKKALRLLQEINRLLRPYTFRRSVARYLLVDEDGAPALQTRTAVIRPIPFSERERGTTIEKTYAVEILLDLAEHSALDRLRKCPICELYFMGRPDQTYCGGKCSRKKYRQEHKEELKDYMRKRRKEERAEERKLNQAIASLLSPRGKAKV